MVITLKKFGTALISRQAGREAFAALQPLITAVAEGENIVADFDGVITLAPSWGDEFLTPLREKYAGRLLLTNIHNNPSVTASLEILEKSRGLEFRIADQ